MFIIFKRFGCRHKNITNVAHLVESKDRLGKVILKSRYEWRCKDCGKVIKKKRGMTK